MPRIHAITTIEILACTLPIFLSSINQATDGSKREIAELHAAIETSIKNIAPINNPADMFPKAMGKLINIKPGPAVGSSPAVEKTIENIIKPETIATRLSKKATVITVLPILASCGM